MIIAGFFPIIFSFGSIIAPEFVVPDGPLSLIQSAHSRTTLNESWQSLITAIAVSISLGSRNPGWANTANSILSDIQQQLRCDEQSLVSILGKQPSGGP